MADSAAVRVSDLRVVRGKREVLHGISFEIEPGTITGLIGPSGCGKSTLMRTIVGVQRIQGGTVTVLGRPAGSPQLRREVGYSTQAPSVYADLPVIDNLRYFGTLLGAPAGDAARVLEEVGLVPQAKQQVSRLSGGQLSRASLAVALLGRPRLLVLDEPTVGLDPLLREDLWALFRRIAAGGERTLLVSSHVMDEAARCDRLVLVRDGRVLADDAPAALGTKTGTQNLDQAFLALVRQQPETAGHV